MSDYVISLSESNVSHVEKIEHEATEQTPTLTDYRYTGANEEVNNYVYFGCSDNCTEDNLYRIIGVIPTQSTINGEYENRVKLIRNNYYTETTSGYLKNGKTYTWNNQNSNKWESSVLNTQVLNKIYWDSLTQFQNYIAASVWYLGAPDGRLSADYTPEQFYSNERSNVKGYSGGLISYVEEIGLMYTSDYGFSIGKEYQNISINSHFSIYTTDSWLFHKADVSTNEWTISPECAYSGIGSWAIYNNGYVSDRDVFKDNYFNFIRPCFYLRADVQYKSGEGTLANPYRIAI